MRYDLRPINRKFVAFADSLYKYSRNTLSKKKFAQELFEIEGIEQDLEAISAAALNLNDYCTQALVKIKEQKGEAMPEGEGEGAMVPEGAGVTDFTEGPEEMEFEEGEPEEGEEEEEGEEPEGPPGQEEDHAGEEEEEEEKKAASRMASQIKYMLSHLTPRQVWPVGGGIAQIVRAIDANRQFIITRDRKNARRFLVSRRVQVRKGR